MELYLEGFVIVLCFSLNLYTYFKLKRIVDEVEVLRCKINIMNMSNMKFKKGQYIKYSESIGYIESVNVNNIYAPYFIRTPYFNGYLSENEISAIGKK